jgi:hypothetical protein
VEDARPSILVGLHGDEVVFQAPLDPGTLARNVLHRIEGWRDGPLLRLALDGNEVGSLPLADGAGEWVLATGIRGTEIARIGSGPDRGGIHWVRPWQCKGFAVLPVFALLFAFFASGCAGLRPWARWLVAAAATAAAIALWQPSSAMLITILLLVLVLIASFFHHLFALVRARVTRRNRRAVLRRFMARSVLAGAAIAALVGLRVLGGREDPGRFQDPPVLCAAESPATLPAAGRLPRVVVFGSSTAKGEGLSDPDHETFAGRLAVLLEGEARVELHARKGATLAELMPLTEEALAEPADVVVLYSTFNDAMFSDGSLGETLLLGGVFDLYRLSYDSSALMTRNHSSYRKLYEERVRAFVRRAKVAGARVLLVGEVGADQVIFPKAVHGLDLFYGSMARVAAEEGEAFLDVATDLRARADDILFIDAMHVNALGHCHLARSILPEVRRLLASREAGR